MAEARRVGEREAVGDAAWIRLPPAALKARIRDALDPIGGEALRTPRSDHDLNPEIPPPIDGLTRAAVLIALIERSSGFQVLFTQRADHMRRHAGQISFPGGRCEGGEGPAAAALREAFEEIGLDPGLVELAGLSTPYRTLTGYHIVPVVGFVRPEAALRADPGEVAELFEVPFDFLMDPANHQRRRREVPPGPPRWHWAIDAEGRNIWGATAGMLRALYERLAGPDVPRS